MAYDISIDGIVASSIGLLVVKRPDFPSPKKRYNEQVVLGRDGKLYQDTGLYEDIDIQIEFNYMTSPDNWHNVWRKAKKWLLSSYGKKLMCSDDISMYYLIKKVEIDTNVRNSLRIGKFSVSFTIDPYTYLTDGIKKYELTGNIVNFFEVSKPIYYISGEGMCTITINNHEIKANVGQNLIIDVYRKMAFRDNGALENVAISGDFDDMVLIEGVNEISISPSSFKLQIQPNWRCI